MDIVRALRAAEEEFDELCFEYGIELDDVTSEKQMKRKELGEVDAGVRALPRCSHVATHNGPAVLPHSASPRRDPPSNRTDARYHRPPQIDDDEDIIYKIDIPANRYDMLCVEGIARALNVFRQKIPAPTYTVAPSATQKMIVKPETALVRPFVVCAVLRGVTFDKIKYNSFIDLQDKLHQNLW